MVKGVLGTASPLGFETKFHEVRSGDVVGTLSSILKDEPDVLFVTPDIFLYTHRRLIIEFTLTNKIPALYGHKEYVAEGGLMSLGPNREEVFRRAAAFVDKVLKGALAAKAHRKASCRRTPVMTNHGCCRVVLLDQFSDASHGIRARGRPKPR
jgi:ABC-type uncharacterized transport system substrate-binding protein